MRVSCSQNASQIVPGSANSGDQRWGPPFRGAGNIIGETFWMVGDGTFWQETSEISKNHSKVVSYLSRNILKVYIKKLFLNIGYLSSSSENIIFM